VSHEMLTAQGSKITASEIRQMRERIMRERAKESEGYDIKLGPGGIEEIEFMVQFLQLKNCAEHRSLLVQNTLAAIRRLGAAGIIAHTEAKIFSDAYIFFRTIECLLRLRGEAVLKKDAENLRNVAEFIGMKNAADLSVELEHKRAEINKLSEKNLRDS